jgi:carboxyl-terminal processing protease
MKHRRSFSFVFAITLAVVTLAATTRLREVLAFGDDLYSRIRIFTQVLDTIQRAYVDERDPDELLDDAIKGMLSHLDPHTAFLPAEQFDNWTQAFEGYSGIGISFDILRDKITVMSVMEGGPSDRAGLRPGDRIVAINGRSAVGLKRDDVPRKLMGPTGTSVEVSIEREGWARPKRFQIVRDRIVLKSIPHAYMLDSKTGYVKIDRFTGSTAKELDTHLQRLERQGMKQLVLDMRGNSGGYLTAAVDVCDTFLPGGRKIVYTKGRSPSSFQEYFSTDARTHPLFPMVVLIDHATASASEIVAGALQDWDRALIVGQTSFGKGLVQSQYRFPDGSALLLTTARFYTPSGRQIQRDYTEKTKEQYYAEAYADPATIRWRATRQPSYKTAIGRTVRGGGGIFPDVWIEAGERPLSDLVRRVLFSEKRYLYTFVVDLAASQPVLKRMGLNRFISDYKVSDRTLANFISLVEEMGANFQVRKLYRYSDDLKFLIKRELAYLLWGPRGRFLVNMERDAELRQALLYFNQAETLLESQK